MGKLIKILVALAALAALAFGASPFYTVSKIVAALDAKDANALAPYVDFVAAREDLGRQIETRVGVSTPDSANPLSGLAGSLARALATPVLDTLITPEGLQTLLRGDEPADAAAPPALDPETRKPEPTSGDKIRTKTAYQGLDSFAVTVWPRGAAEDQPLVVRLQRENLIGWKVIGIDLPADFSFSS